MTQNNTERYVAMKLQAGRNQIASGSGASILPVAGGRGQATTNAVQSAEVRRDGQSTRGRHGSRRAQGNYPGEMQLANYDAILAAILRGTWAAATSISNATTGFTSATLAVASNVVTLTGETGSLLSVSGGPKVGDIVTFASGVHADDRARPLRVASVTADTITFADTMTNVTGPISAWSFTVASKLINPAAGATTERYYTIEENELQIDGSEVFSDCKWGQVTFAMAPNGMFTIDPMWMGTGAMQVVTGVAAPYFTSPSDPAAAVKVAAIDCTLRVGSTDIGVSAFNLVVSINLSTFDEANSVISPDVFSGSMTVSGSFTCLRRDLSLVASSLAEEQLSLSVLLQPEGSQTSWFGFHLPNFTIPIPDKSEMSKQGGPMTQTITIPAELVGKDERGGAYDATTIKFMRSNS